jgi:hypothetical protein
MDIKQILKNQTRMQSLDFIGDFIIELKKQYDPSGIDAHLEDAYFHISKAIDEHATWIARGTEEEDVIMYANFRRDMDSD